MSGMYAAFAPKVSEYRAPSITRTTTFCPNAAIETTASKKSASKFRSNILFLMFFRSQFLVYGSWFKALLCPPE
jgi:hypothetical protein